jgi:hypothetical protein
MIDAAGPKSFGPKGKEVKREAVTARGIRRNTTKKP